MGAGTYYTHPNGEKASWINFHDGAEPHEIDEIIDDLEHIICKHTSFYKTDKTCVFSNHFFILELESKYYGDGLIFKLTRRQEYEFANSGLFTIAESNFHIYENKVLKAIQKAGYVLNIAISGYQSKEYKL